MSDILRQVDEDIRKERYLNIWKRYGLFVIVFAGLLIFTTISYQVYMSIKISNDQKIVERYISAKTINDINMSLDNLSNLEDTSNDFLSGLVKLKIADLYAKEKNYEMSKSKLNEIINNNKFERIIRDQAIYSYLMLEVNKMNNDQIMSFIPDFKSNETSYNHLYKELLAINYFLENKNIKSLEIFNQIVNNPTISPEIKIRAEKFIETLE